jgi:arabinose-5-phosphate isomerase
MPDESSSLTAFVEVLRQEAQVLQSAADQFSRDSGSSVPLAVKLLQDRLDSGGRIILSGIGKSGKIAQKISATLSSTGSPSFYLHPTEALHGDLGMVGTNDALVALSQTGKTEELLTLVRVLREQNIPVIALCGRNESELVRLSQAWLSTHVDQEACPLNLAPTSSTTLALALGDALAVTLMKARGFQANHFARNHPGGSLGRRLHLRVSDLMESGEKIGKISAHATFEQVIEALTTYPLGAVLVTEGERLVGLITDGDIRRALRKPSFFSLPVAEIMTRNPITISADRLATEALELMENRPSQISVLPVVDSTGQWKGLIRLHDLVRAL